MTQFSLHLLPNCRQIRYVLAPGTYKRSCVLFSDQHFQALKIKVGFVVVHSLTTKNALLLKSQCKVAHPFREWDRKPGHPTMFSASCLRTSLGKRVQLPWFLRSYTDLSWINVRTLSSIQESLKMLDGCCFLQSQHVEMRCCCLWQTTVQKKNLLVSNVTFASEVTKKSSVISSDINQLNCPYMHTQQ